MTVFIIMGPQRPDGDRLAPELSQQLSGRRVRLVGFSAGDNPDGDDHGLISHSALQTICQDHLGLHVVSHGDEPDGSGTPAVELGDLIVISQDDLLHRAQQGEALERLPTVVVCRGTTIELPYAVYSLINWREHIVNFCPQPYMPTDSIPSGPCTETAGARLFSNVVRVQCHDLAKGLVRSLNRWRELQERPLESLGVVSPKEPPPSSWPAPVQLCDASSSEVPMEFLIADDNDIVIKILEKIMTNLDLSYRVARNGREAVEAYKANPDLCRCILMDLAMPVISGLDATTMIREYEREQELPPAIIIGLKAGSFLEPLHPGFDFNLKRPIRQDQLRVALSSRGIIPG